MEVNGISVISPMWGDRTITDRMVFSVMHQYISKDNPIDIELVLVDDYLEKRGENGESPYDYYVSEEFKQFYDPEHISIKLIKNKKHEYQGQGREIGFNAAKYNWFLLIDCDDMLSPNACDRYLCIIDKFINDQKEALERKEIDKVKKLACVNGFTYGFSTMGNEQKIVGHSIWVQGRCYNREFIKEYDLHFPTGLNSRQAEDYPFIRKFDYAMQHSEDYIAIGLPYEQGQDCQCTAFWFPNEESLSRKDPHYGQHLAGWTMRSSLEIQKFFDEFNKKYGFEDQEDEVMKHEYLQMNIYAFYNLLDFFREVSMTDYEPVKEDWYELRDAVAELRQKLKDKYWDEIVYSDVEDQLFNTHHHSDVRFVESWIGNFYDYMNKDVLVTVEKFDDVDRELKYVGQTFDIFKMEYDEMMDYCHSLLFDSVPHETHMSQVRAWISRHPKKEEEKEEDKKSKKSKKDGKLAKFKKKK